MILAMERDGLCDKRQSQILTPVVRCSVVPKQLRPAELQDGQHGSDKHQTLQTRR